MSAPTNHDELVGTAPAGFPVQGVRAALLGIVGSVLAAICVVSVIALLRLPAPVAVVGFYAPLFAGLVLTARWASERWGTASFRTDFGWRFQPSDLWRGALLFVVAGILAGLAASPWPTESWEGSSAWLDVADGPTVAVFAVFAVLAAPLFEELIFRGLLLRSLTSRYGPRLAIAIQAVIFGLYHVDPAAGADNIPAVIYLAVAGAVLGFAATRYQRLGPSMVAHCLTNLTVVTMIAGGQ